MSWDCKEDEMRASVCPKEVPVGDLSCTDLGFRQSQAQLAHGGSVEETRHATFCAKRRNSPMVSKTPSDLM